jgi:hypothetical protein
MGNIKDLILEKIEMAQNLLPEQYLEPLPPKEELMGAPEWRKFDHSLWKLGEDIRQYFLRAPRLRNDKELQAKLLSIACDRRALRGRQSFIMLFASKSSREYANDIASQLGDPSVDGQVIYTLYRMRAKGFAENIRSFTQHDRSWVRKEAKRYILWEQGV